MYTLESQSRFLDWKNPTVDVGVLHSEPKILGEQLHKVYPFINVVPTRLLAEFSVEVIVCQLLPSQVAFFSPGKSERLAACGTIEEPATAAPRAIQLRRSTDERVLALTVGNQIVVGLCQKYADGRFHRSVWCLVFCGTSELDVALEHGML